MVSRQRDETVEEAVARDEVYKKKHHARPETKERLKVRNATPAAKAYQKAYQKAYRETESARQKEYREAANAKYSASPEAKERPKVAAASRVTALREANAQWWNTLTQAEQDSHKAQGAQHGAQGAQWWSTLTQAEQDSHNAVSKARAEEWQGATEERRLEMRLEAVRARAARKGIRKRLTDAEWVARKAATKAREAEIAGQVKAARQTAKKARMDARTVLTAVDASAYDRNKRCVRKYGCTFEELDKLRCVTQRGLCAACGAPLGPWVGHGANSNALSSVVDHCHSSEGGTGRRAVRGVVHSLCNTGLGAGRDDPEVFRRWAKYRAKADGARPFRPLGQLQIGAAASAVTNEEVCDG